MKKRMLSALLCLCMMLTMIPAAFAVENETVDTPADSGQADTVPDDTSTETAGITTQQALEAEIKNASDGGTVTLGSDVTITSTIKITGKNLTLDMNGKKICNSSDIWDNNDAEWSLISVGDNANLTIKGNGSFQAKANDCYAIDIVDGGRCIIQDGTFDGNISAVYVLEGDLVVNGGRFSIQQTDQNKGYAFLLNCFDENYKNDKARITVNGGTFENFNPRACAAESTGNTTNFCASGIKVTESTDDNITFYTVEELDDGEMVVNPVPSEDGSVSATLEGIYNGDNTTVTDDDDQQGDSETSANAGAVTVDLSTENAESATSATLTMPAETAKSLGGENGADSLTVKTNVGDVKLDATALDKMGDTKGNVVISIEKIDDTSSETNVAAAYTVEVKSGDKNLLPEGTSNGTITITIDKPTKLSSMWYVVSQEDGNWLYVEKLKYEEIDGSKIAVYINHLSSIVAYSGEGDPQNTEKVQVTEADGTVEHYATLSEAISGAENGATVKLLKDVALTTGVDVANNLTLDLNGNKISADKEWIGSDYLVVVNRGGNLTIADSSQDNSGAICTGTDNSSIYAAVKLTLANDSGTDAATLTVNGGTLQGYYYGISGNGTRHGTAVTINGGTIIGTNGTGIYHPQYGILTIKGGELSGLNTAVELRSGTLNISGGTFTAKATEYKEEQNSSGTTVSGAAIAISQHTTKKDISVTISGGTFNGVYALRETNVQNSTGTENVEIVTIDGGTFNGTVKSDDCKSFISGGNFSDSVNTDYLTSGINYEVYSGSGDTPYSYHTNIDDAMEAAGSTGTITVVNNGEMATHTVTFDYNYDIDDSTVTVVDGDAITLPNPTRPDYDLEGWRSSADNDLHKAGDKVEITSNVTFVADWDRRSSGGSSGGSSSSNRYTVSVDSGIENGDISVSPSRAERGDTVTITIDPDEGYELDSLTVRDSRGNRIDVERQSDTRYTFEMPSGRVTVDASFTEVAETPETPDQIGSFTDVDTDDWFADAVQYMLDNGMMNGVTDTTFGPGTTTTRGMIVTILYRLEGEPDTTASSFTDAASGMYYADAVAWAQANSIVTGITETIFAPDQAITREQMAAILYRYAQYKGYDVTASNDLSSYTDASRISAYATAAMQWANAEGLITGNTSTTINPTGNATRAEVATILMRFCETVTK